MAILIWGTRAKSVDLGPAGAGDCPACGPERPFRWRLDYKAHHLYYAFGFVSGKRYLRACEVCGRGEVQPAAAVEASLGRSVIPFMERFGCLTAVGGLAAVVLFLSLLRLLGPEPRNVPELTARAARGDAAALARLRSEAGAGDVPSQEALMDVYRLGSGVAADPAEAFLWARRAAEAGNARAQHTLGMMYELGQGTPVDYARALEWYTKAEAQHVAASANGIGTLHFRGLGVKQDAAEGVRWFRKAAEAGDAAGALNLAGRCLAGEGVAADPKEARRWLEQAAASTGQDDETLGVVALARYGLGRLYEEGNGVEKDVVKALRLYEQAAPRCEDARRDFERLKARLSG
ncbi:MAG: tetratricopeptide repeat protein [Thermoanaerobaculia bacterium]